MALDLLASKLSPEDCVNRVRATTGDMWAISGPCPVLAWIGNRSAVLRKRTFWINGFRTVLRVKFFNDGEGTLLRCRSGMSYASWGWLIGWFGFLFLIEGALVVAALTDRARLEITPAAALGIPALFAGIGGAFVVVGRWFAKDDREFLLDFLSRAVEARPE